MKTLALLCATTALLLAAAAGPAAARPARLSVAPASRAAVLRTHHVRVRVSVPAGARVRLDGYAAHAVPRGRRITHGALRARSLLFRRAGIRRVTLSLTPAGLRSLRACSRAEASVRAVVRSGGLTRTTRRALRFPAELGACRRGTLPASLPAPAAAGAPSTHGYLVGAAARAINPDADGTFAGQPVYLGGYGIASPPADAGRPATGFLGDGLHVRALAVSDGEHSVAVADLESQGWFVAQRDAPYGLLDMRKEVEKRTHGALKASSVVIQSDHTHGGPDGLGVWGGVPVEYRRLVFERTVDAIVAAYGSRREGTLYYGTAPGRDLLSNQFDYDAANQAVDSDVRVLQARDQFDRPFVTVLDFSAHATVLGSDNTKATGDWVQAANPLIARRLGGEPVTIVATLGRTQPADRGCHDAGLKGDAASLCALDDYASRVVDRARAAVAAARPLSGRPVVGGDSYLIRDVASSPLLIGLLVGGQPVGAPLNRSLSPPWFTGNVIGTVAASLRIGDVLLSAFPGEAYPQIALRVAGTVKAARGFMTAGLANDQLGYLIAPYEAYPEPVRRSFFNQRGDEVSPIDNDNYFFNVSHTMGERVTCAALRGAGELFGQGSAYRDSYDRCSAFANDALERPGADVSG